MIAWLCCVTDSLWIKPTDAPNSKFTTVHVPESLSAHHQEFRNENQQNYSLRIKPTDAPNSKFIGITTLHFSESLSAHHQEFRNENQQNYSLRMKPTDAPNSKFIGITTLHVSDSFSAHHQEFLALHRLWYILCSCGYRLLPGVGWNSMEFHPTPGSKGSSQLHKMYQRRCMTKNSWWWAEKLSETCRVVIPINFEFGASVGFIRKE